MLKFLVDHPEPNVENGLSNSQQNNKTHFCDTSDYAESSLTEEAHKVQQDSARSFLQDFIHGKNCLGHQALQQSDHVKDKGEEKLNPALQINSHFKELKMKQHEEQKQFHQKLMKELCTSASRMKASTTFVDSGTEMFARNKAIRKLYTLPFVI